MTISQVVESTQPVALVSPTSHSRHVIDQYFKEKEKGFINGKKYLVVQDDQLNCLSRWDAFKAKINGFFGGQEKVHLADVAEFCQSKKIDHCRLGTELLEFNQKCQRPREFWLFPLRRIKSEVVSHVIKNGFEASLERVGSINELRENITLTEVNTYIKCLATLTLPDTPETLLDKVLKRFYQIEKATQNNLFEESKMSVYDLFCHAFFIERECIKVKYATARVFRKQETALSHTLQYDPVKNFLYILANPKVSKIKSEGRFKRMVSAVGIAIKNYSVVTIAARLFTKQLSTPVELQCARFEMDLLKKFSFVKLYTACMHTYGKAKNRLSMIFELCDGDLEKIVKGKILVSINEKLFIMQDILSNLKVVHAENYLHGDIRPHNILVKNPGSDRQRIQAIITDFGTSRKIRKGKNLGNTERYNRGYYALPWLTSPEFFGIKNFQGNHFKVEIFAVGALLYWLRFGKLPTWSYIIHTCYEAKAIDPAVLTLNQAKVSELVTQEVEVKFSKLLEKYNADGNLSADEKFDFVLYQLMRLDPRQRLSAAAACKLIKKIM